ncbi:SDR family oxidoreductase [Flavobacterium rhizosphaerae]|uniref:SDR family oxidoreductase n=1 Tax=Flavobacterium rhizosphaerae TaxID=3163298 RepID=A0ABW8Z012_9FLAO
MILVTGSTGQLGTAVVNYLQERVPASKIAVLARDAQKAQHYADKGITVRVGDYHDYASLVTAFEGIEKVLLISSSDFNDRVGQQINVINAAKQAGVKHIAYTGIEDKDAHNSATGILAKDHAETGDYLKASGVGYTLLNNSLYADVIPMFVGENVLENGIFFPAGQGRVPFATRDDMALAAAVVLTTQGHENKEYAIANDESLSFKDIAEIISEITGKQITYTSPDAETYKNVLKEAGVPDNFIWMLSGFAQAIKDKELETGKAYLSKLIDKKPTSVKEFLTQVYK